VSQNVAIVGYGAAAVNAIIALRNSGYSGQITVFSETENMPYSPVITGYYVGGTKTYEECFPWSEDELTALNLDVHAGEGVIDVDVDNHKVVTQLAQYEYDKCLIAAGASPVVADFPESLCDADGCCQALYTLRTLDDAQRLRDAICAPNCDSVLVMGTSMVGLRAVDAALARGKKVTLLGRSEHIMKRTALPEIATLLEQHLRSAGVNLRLGQTIEYGEIVESDEPDIVASNQCRVRINFSNGEVEDFSLVIAAQGVVPNTDMLEDDAVLDSKGIVVDEFMRTKCTDVFAAGDVARVTNLQGGSSVAGLWKEACLQGACAGAAMAAELAGIAPDNNKAYKGFFPNNQIIVAGAVVFSGGSFELNEHRWADIEELESCTLARVFERDVENETSKLVGYNVFAKNAEPLMNDAYEIAAMQYRRLKEVCK
jgi:NADPH-dependent 2,4-dienoyl-CoA reductase/sulfur reductase-like enzyme